MSRVDYSRSVAHSEFLSPRTMYVLLYEFCEPIEGLFGEKIPKFEVDGFERRRVNWFFVRLEFVAGRRSE